MSFIRSHSTRDNVGNLVYDPEVIINKLEELRLQPLKSSYDKLSSLVADNSHYFDDTLTQKAKNILDILYNILYSYAIVDVMTHMIMMPAVANSPKNHDLQNVISRTEVLANSYASQYKLLLMKASLNIEPADNIDKMNAALTNLKNLGLSHKCSS
ncbi:MAG: hypothetical protein NMK33_05490 [Candidatus Cardinium sp.]|uniref:hypothetical protein n=1 Tax=Cardinium endosymbiont of Dermatophagoides farinae TaxID=2597823 RepID=UPI00118268BB|nr:hypothetical protein [Cardinium endosymbiont of Dermatophagoides farinae]TSJ80864.1 hypothetical protein FPG78_02290 [Cardinium endosymbiont of Dermatophagoides farinae]UWW96871.1 MAG: hypothetical protein NMK33_05490 [Candidatus Cardinium sp.]